ncbi:phytanoyl-CoA dioxygenase family protein [Kribbella pittospori]|uniref:Phytanoyl-CoA dioxygenase family protein n=1 Tax=Kribbella pittospori TaxID=722689 RepID=A0A4V2MAY5_9ACTN|nr:phytanoyl-CoA dioxygenase family protein [Kribbella pittospori]TCC60992.1 phytanoyl-CoA dioxygenase family protein [Kribbella pittospori]
MPPVTAVRRFTEVTDELIESFQRDGFVVLDQALPPDQVAALHTAAEDLCRGDLGEVEGGPSTEPGEDVLRKYLCIHQPHKVSDAALAALHAPRVVTALTALIGPNVKAMQSMLFIKSEGKPGQAWHQDEFFIPTRDRSLTAVWIALDDATVENGCLWVLPGSHRRGVIYPDREQDDLRFDCTVELFDFPYSDDDAVPVEVPAGAAVIFNGYLLHRSLPNTSRRGLRRALANHYMSAESLLPWHSVPADVHVGKHDYRDIVMVAGTDPYAYKGIDDIARPHSRADKDGGCDR